MKKIISALLAVMISAASFAVTADAASWKKTKYGYVYTYSDGSIAKSGWLKVGKKTYYIQPDGTRKTGWLKTKQGAKYYFDKDGVMAANKRLKFSDGSYYFLSNGKMAVEYCLKIGKNFYYYGRDGRLADTAYLAFGLALDDFMNVIDEKYYGEGFDTDEPYGYSTLNIGLPEDAEYCVFTCSEHKYYDNLYEFRDGYLTAYGYMFNDEDVAPTTVIDYFKEKFDAAPTYVFAGSEACYWDLGRYYLSLFHYEADRYCAVYSTDKPYIADDIII